MTCLVTMDPVMADALADGTTTDVRGVYVFQRALCWLALTLLFAVHWFPAQAFATPLWWLGWLGAVVLPPLMLLAAYALYILLEDQLTTLWEKLTRDG